MVLTACGAGSRTGAETAVAVACDFENPPQATTVNVLAYNSSAVDPFTNTMVKSCSHDNVTVKHDPIDFGGQVQKTVATLSGDKGSYDVVETYSFVVATYAAQGKIQPLDDLFAKYADKYKLNDLSPEMLKGMSYDGKLYGLPMQAQTQVLAYRKDIFDKLGLTPPKTFEEMRTVAKKIQDAGEIKYPLALPWLSNADIVTGFGAAMGSQGTDYVDDATKKANLTSDAAVKSLEQMKSLLPYMDPQVTTFDQPKVQQQLFNGSAAMGIMFSGRMLDLTLEKNSKFSANFAFAAPPKVFADSPKQYGALSIDGWSLPTNTSVSPDLLFQLIAASVSEDASKSSVPAAYPARIGMATTANTPYAAAAEDSIKNAPPLQPYPYIPAVGGAITPIVAKVVTGGQSIPDGTEQMQQAVEDILAKQ
ncbi:ABC transporter substrate-binding protein [uncultured Friedmanniella sp.]|uniref:ABC transporter substrate-binding protein n=1 Tax=uncultured Friedmanniella sp. TaxID=335381 RepID=UPI0035CBA428